MAPALASPGLVSIVLIKEEGAGCEGGDTGTRTGAGVGTAKTIERNTVAMERVLISQDEVHACIKASCVIPELLGNVSFDLAFTTEKTMDNLNLTKYFHRSLFRIPESVNKCMDTIQTNVYNFTKISTF